MSVLRGQMAIQSNGQLSLIISFPLLQLRLAGLDVMTLNNTTLILRVEATL